MIDKAHMLLAFAGYERAEAQWIIDGVLQLAGYTDPPEIVAYVCGQLRCQS
jgi:hypothetical protein